MDKWTACVLTILIEGFIIALLRKKIDKNLFLKVLFVSILLNIVTNLSLNWVLHYVSNIENWKYMLIVCGLEILIIGIETMIYVVVTKKWRLSWMISGITNCVSFLFGSFLLSLLIYIIK